MSNTGSQHTNQGPGNYQKRQSNRGGQYFPHPFPQQDQQQPYIHANQMYYPQQTYYSNQYMAVPPTGLYRPQDYANSHLNVTTATGEKVELEQLNQTPKSQHATLNKTPVLASPGLASAKIVVDDKAAELQRAFRERVAAKAKAAAEKSKKTDEPQQEQEANVEKPAVIIPTETVKVDAPKSEDKDASIKAFQESVAAKAKKLTPEPAETPKEEVKEEAKEETKQETKEEPKAEEPKVEEPEAEESKVEESVAEEPVADESNAEEPKVQETTSTEQPEQEQERNLTQETIAEDPNAEEASEEATAEEPSEPDANSVTAFLERVANAKAIDAFSFQYSSKVSPPNPDIKKDNIKYRYNVGFLMQFRDSTKFTIDAEYGKKIEFILRSNNNNRGDSSRNRGFKFGSGSGLSGSQNFSKSSSNMRRNFDMNSRSNSRQNSKRRGASNRGDRKSNRNRERDFEREREPEVPAEPVKPLEKSATRWVPKSRASKATEVKYAPDGVTVLLSADDVTRKVNSLLNKLTLEFFDSITDEIIAIANQSKWEENAETLKLVINLTFDKATDEPHWSEMYAMFCAKLMTSINDEVKDASNVRDDKPISGNILVRVLLLSKCQAEYEKGWSDKLPTNEDGTPLEPEMMTDEYYTAAAAKRRGLGLVRFIGHLFVLRLLSSGVIRSCLVKLTENTTDPSEDTVENLIQLIKTVGPTLDSDKSSAMMMNVVFEKVKQLESAKIPSRLEFALLDLRDLRKKNWAGLTDKGPKTISQIHEEERMKHMEEQRSNDRKRQNKSESRSGSTRNSGWSNSRVSESDIRRVGQVSSSSSSNLGPMNNFTKSRSLRKPQNQDNFERSDSSRQNSSKPEQNRFALLNDDEEHKNHDDEEEAAQEEEEVVQEEEVTEEAAKKASE
jgi:translation initiation factor 4G